MQESDVVVSLALKNGQDEGSYIANMRTWTQSIIYSTALANQLMKVKKCFELPYIDTTNDFTHHSVAQCRCRLMASI